MAPRNSTRRGSVLPKALIGAGAVAAIGLGGLTIKHSLRRPEPVAVPAEAREIHAEMVSRGSPHAADLARIWHALKSNPRSPLNLSARDLSILDSVARESGMHPARIVLWGASRPIDRTQDGMRRMFTFPSDPKDGVAFTKAMQRIYDAVGSKASLLAQFPVVGRNSVQGLPYGQLRGTGALRRFIDRRVKRKDDNYKNSPHGSIVGK